MLKSYVVLNSKEQNRAILFFPHCPVNYAYWHIVWNIKPIKNNTFVFQKSC